jgi:hypothetical protein
MRTVEVVLNDIHNLRVSLATLEREYTLLKFGRYVEEFDLARLQVVIRHVREKIWELNMEREMLRG